jgi:hypothetical protein
MHSQQRRNKLRDTRSDVSATAGQRPQRLRPSCDRPETFRGRRARWQHEPAAAALPRTQHVKSSAPQQSSRSPKLLQLVSARRNTLSSDASSLDESTGAETSVSAAMRAAFDRPFPSTSLSRSNTACICSLSRRLALSAMGSVHKMRVGRPKRGAAAFDQCTVRGGFPCRAGGFRATLDEIMPPAERPGTTGIYVPSTRDLAFPVRGCERSVAIIDDEI